MRPPLRGSASALLFLVGAGAALALPEAAEAQGWVVDLHAGRASFETLPTGTSTTNASLGPRFARDYRFFQLAVAGPLASDNLFWGMVGAGERLAFRRGRVEAGLDLSALAHGQRDPLAGLSGWGVRGDALPLISLSAGPLVAELRSGGSWYQARTGDADWSRSFRSSDIRVITAPGPALRISGELRRVENSRESYTFVGVSASGAVGRVILWGSVGDWVSGLESGSSSTSWGAGASVAVLPSMDVWVSLRREAFEPLYLATSQTSGGLGVSYRLASARSRPSPAGPELRGRGRVVLRLPLSGVSSPPWVAGDFSGWEAVPMYRHGLHWRLELSLEPGVYHYAFRSAEGVWFVPETVPGRRDDGMGGWLAVLIVP